MKKITHVVFDFGDVLNFFQQTPEEKNILANTANLEYDVFFDRYYFHRKDYDLGKLTPENYWQKVLESPSLEKIQKMRELDIQVSRRLNTKVWLWLGKLQQYDMTLTLLSNMPQELANYHQENSIKDNFHHVFFSYDIGMVKPDAEIYEFVIKHTQQMPEETFFIDDSLHNVESARKVGWYAFHYQNLEDLSEYVKQYHFLPNVD